ncbi:MAG: AMP-binding protein [Candidatus Tectomicrobia bacterium]|nr:AMP-binding protein [Candidatus Tectomicrobia bacterium]
MKVTAHLPPERLQRCVASQDWLHLFMHEYVDRWERERPERVAFTDGERTMTWRQVAAVTRSLARSLAALGVGRGDVVSVQLPNILEFPLLHLALSRLGAVINPVHMAFRQAEIAGVAKHAEAKVLICTDTYKGVKYLEMIQGMRDRLPTVQHLVVLGEPRGESCHSLASLLEAPGGQEPSLVPLDDGAALALFYTSGTTGDPKGVIHTHFAPLSNAGYCLDEWHMDEHTVLMTLAPYTFAFGTWAIYCSVARGITQVLLETFEVERFCDKVQRHKVSLLYWSPAHAIMVFADETWRRYDFSRLGTVLFSGTSVPPSLVKQVGSRLGGKVIVLWGMSECYGTLITRLEDATEIIERTVGRAARGCEVAIIDAEGREVPRREVGELAQRGANLFTHYYKNPAVTAASFTADGWFRSGDLATMDAAGNVTIVSRLKDMINRGGTKIYPAELEAMLMEYPKIQAAAIVAMPDERLGEKSCLYAVPRPRQTITLEDITAFLSERGVAKFKFPERLEILERLPLNPSNKVDKMTLRRWAAEAAAKT